MSRLSGFTVLILGWSVHIAGFGACYLLTCWSSLALAVDYAQRPNIVWLTSEDHGPHLGCYGDKYASTPNIDALAAKGLIYRHAWSNAPVCAPARTTLISGLYASSTGAEHMRSMVAYPAGKQMFPQLLRAAGYYCTNNVKEDYNLAQPGQVWDESSRKAHWKNRAVDQPFFAVFNSTKSHESQIRTRPHTLVHDPAGVRLPAYHPDTPEVRHDWAQYYDGVNAADADAGEHLRELDEAGLLDSTIVFYFADHGSGMPRSKRSACNSGLQVPLVLYIPEKFRHLRPSDYVAGGATDRLVSFVDFAPTVLSLASVEPPDWMQGHAFLGPYAAPPQPFLYGFRARMDERYDMMRSATDGRFVYVRNYLPHKLPGQYLSYMFQTPTTQVWHRLHEEGKLTAAQDNFWRPKPAEELYDLSSDPDEINNLAGTPQHQETLERLRRAQQALAQRIRDVGYLPEGEMHARSAGSTPYDMGHDEAKYPFDRIMQAAELASRSDGNVVRPLVEALGDADSAVRYWGAIGMLVRGATAVQAGRETLNTALADAAPFVRVAAGEALARYGTPADRETALAELAKLADCQQNDVFVAMAAFNAIESLDDIPDELRDQLKQLPTKSPVPHARYGEYITRLIGEL